MTLHTRTFHFSATLLTLFAGTDCRRSDIESSTDDGQLHWFAPRKRSTTHSVIDSKPANAPLTTLSWVASFVSDDTLAAHEVDRKNRTPASVAENEGANKASVGKEMDQVHAQDQPQAKMQEAIQEIKPAQLQLGVDVKDTRRFDPTDMAWWLTISVLAAFLFCAVCFFVRPLSGVQGHISVNEDYATEKKNKVFRWSASTKSNDAAEGGSSDAPEKKNDGHAPTREDGEWNSVDGDHATQKKRIRADPPERAPSSFGSSSSSSVDGGTERRSSVAMRENLPRSSGAEGHVDVYPRSSFVEWTTHIRPEIPGIEGLDPTRTDGPAWKCPNSPDGDAVHKLRSV